ncbi:MAG: M15 family metallopeptidase [Actinobacteria bacterium]|nr:M15 family metallopeptidase [Actinomycetota bacterium]
MATASLLGPSWHPGCPVAVDDLRILTLPYWGFDNAPHVGELVIAADASQAVGGLFVELFTAHFPIRKMVTIDHYYTGTDGVAADDASVADDNTAGFNCRQAVDPGGPPSWSEHAYGEAVDVDPVENPYVEANGVVDPSAGQAFTDRGDVRPGMAVPGSIVNRLFAGIGWGWGGNWAGNPDYQHFSVNGQ